MGERSNLRLQNEESNDSLLSNPNEKNFNDGFSFKRYRNWWSRLLNKRKSAQKFHLKTIYRNCYIKTENQRKLQFFPEPYSMINWIKTLIINSKSQLKILCNTYTIKLDKSLLIKNQQKPKQPHKSLSALIAEKNQP